MLRLTAYFSLLAAILPSTYAQAETGILTGRVFNPKTSEYVRNAEVKIDGRGVVTTTGSEGSFRVANLPPGSAIVTVSFSGYKDITTVATIQAGQVTNLSLELVPIGAFVDDDGVFVLEDFVTSAEAEGQARATMQQRASMTIGQSVDSNVFGDITEGNVGEFLKYLPGIEIEMVEADNRGPRLGGMSPQYTGVSVDGMRSASADGFVTWGGTENSQGTGSSSRSFSFEQVSINSIESIEISRITPANLDADAPAGTINMKTKRAFDRKGRLMTFSAGIALNSEEMTLSKTSGPGDSDSRKFKPEFKFDYANSFMDYRLGVLIGYSHSNLYNEQYRVDHQYRRREPTIEDPRTQVLRQLNIKDGPKWTERNTLTGTIDFKITPELIFSMTGSYNTYEAGIDNRIIQLQAGANNEAGIARVSGDGLTTFGTNSANLGPANDRVARTGGGHINKQTDGGTFSPKLTFRRDNLFAEFALAHSYSINSYGAFRTGDTVGNSRVDYSNLQFEATRPSASSSDWTIRQTGGPDWSSVSNSNQTQNTVTDDVRYVYNEINTAKLDLTYDLNTRFPTTLYAGFKYQERIDRAHRRSAINNFRYDGGSISEFPSGFEFEPRGLGVRFESINGGAAPQYTNRETLGRLITESPELFTRTFNATQYHTAMFGEVRDLTEEVPAAYTMARTNFGKLQVQAGLRWEKTDVSSMQFDSLTPSEVIDAGFPASLSTGLATTPAGLDYQFRTRPKINRTSDYDHVFPSISGKYRLGDNLIFDLGYGTSIRRPELAALSGAFSINEVSEVIRLPNSDLQPETSDRIAASAAYYFGDTSNLSLTLTETNLEDFFVSTTVENGAADFGFTDPELQNYDVITLLNDERSQRFRSMEVAYRHVLQKLPDFIDSASVFGTYTRTYSKTRSQGTTPHTITGGFDLGIKRFSFGIKGVWVDDAVWTSTIGRYRESNLKLDSSINVRLTDELTFYIQGRNITEQNHTIWEEIGGNVPVIWRQENYGSNYSVGIRGRF